MVKTRQSLERLQARIEASRLVRPEKIGAAAGRILSRNRGLRDYDWRLQIGTFEFFEHATHSLRERGIRHLKDVIDLRPIHHRSTHRIEGHNFVATLPLLLEPLLERRF